MSPFAFENTPGRIHISPVDLRNPADQLRYRLEFEAGNAAHRRHDLQRRRLADLLILAIRRYLMPQPLFTGATKRQLDEARSVNVTARVTEIARVQLIELAAAEGKSVSTYISDVLMAHLTDRLAQIK